MRYFFCICIAACLYAAGCSTSPASGSESDSIPDTAVFEAPLAGHETAPDQDETVPDIDHATPGYYGPDPETCAYYGANCGTLTTIGGKNIECGTCSEPAICGTVLPNTCAAELCDDGWCWIYPYPQGDTLQALAVAGNNQLFAAGESSLFYIENGLWNRRPYQLRQGGRFTALYAVSATDAWAAATDGSLLRLEDNFFSCVKEVTSDNKNVYWSPVKWPIRALAGDGNGVLWAAGDQGILKWDGSDWLTDFTSKQKLTTILYTKDSAVIAGGDKILVMAQNSEWTPLEAPIAIKALWAQTPADIWAAGTAADNSFLIIRRQKESWITISTVPEEIAAIAGNTADNLFFGGAGGALYHWNGEALGTLPTVSGARAITVMAENNNHLIFGGEGGLFGTYDGKFWCANRFQLPSAPQALFANHPKDIWLGGAGYTAHYNGAVWSLLPVSYTITDIYGSAWNMLYAETSANILLGYDGTSWNTIEKPAAATLEALKKSRDTFLSKTETLLSWQFDAQNSWSIGTAPCCTFNGEGKSTRQWPGEGLTMQPVAAIPGVQEKELWAISETELLHFDGTAWHIEQYPEAALNPTCLAKSGEVLFICSNGALLSYKNRATATVFADVLRPVKAISITSADALFAVAGGDICKITGDNTCTALYSGSYELTSLFAVSENDIWAAGNNIILHFDGTVWHEILPDDLTERGLPQGEISLTITRMFGLDSSNIWMLGASPDGRTAYIFSYNGTKWVVDARTSLYTTHAFTDVWAKSQKDAFFTMDQDGWIYHYTSLGDNGIIDWVEAPAATPFYAITADSTGVLHVFGPDGAILQRVAAN